MGKVLIGILALILLIGVFASQIDTGWDGLRVDPTEEAFVRATGVGVSSSNVTLASDLFEDDLVNITDVASTISETPVATTYTAGTNVLLITNLTANTTRTLTVTFDIETTDDVWAAIGPFGMIIIIGGGAGLIFWGMLSHRRRGN